MSDGTDDRQPAAMAEAAAWLARLRGPSGAQSGEEHARWLAQSPHNRRAFDRVSRAFEGSAVLRRSSRFSAEGRRREERRRRTAIATGTVAASVALVAACWVLVPRLIDTRSPNATSAQLVLSTATGEIRRFELPDGSAAVLDTASRVEVGYDGPAMRLRLVSGRARLALADAADSRTVEAGSARIVADGATLDVALGGGGRVAIAVLEGSALVRPGLGPKGISSLRLGRGQWLTVLAGQPSRAASAAKRADADWPSGWAEHDSVALGDLVAAANRYANPPIVIDEPGVRALRLSGRFHIADPSGLADRTGQLFDLAVVREADGIHLRTRQKNLRPGLR